MKKNLLFYERINSRLFLILLLTISASLSVFAQNRQVTGRVVANENDSLMEGVTVKVKGSNTTTLTNRDGSFSINVPPNAVLVFSSVGYLTQEVAVKNINTFDIKMTNDQQSLQQVVVVGYGTVKRKDLTGSISSVTASQIAQVPVTTLEQAIQGRAAGVQVINNDATPGGNISVLIRGIGSLASGGNAPLYVIDGYPTTGGINNINPLDIASIDVLKDASATAIYGIRAANGVVIITTKKGQKNKVQLSLDAYVSFQSKPKEYHILNAQQFANLANEVEAADSQHVFKAFAPWKDPSSLHSVDWQNAVYQTGLTQNYNIGIRGGGDKLQSAASIGYYDQKGIALGSYFKRYSINLNMDYTPLKWLKSSTSAKYAHQDANTPFGTGSFVQLSQLPPTLDSGNLYTYQIKDNMGNYGFYNPIYTYVAKYGNPVYSIETNRYQNLTNYFLASSSLEATVYDGLKIKTNAGVNINNYSGYYFQPEDDRLVEQYGGAAGATANAFYSQHLNQNFEWLWENTISYDHSFGKHTVNFVGGISAQENTYTAMGGQGIPPNSQIQDLAQVTNLILDPNGNGQVTTSLASTFARLSYNYDEKYFITGTIRRDGSSKFDEGHQYGVFPSGAVAWRIKQESFMQDITWLSDLKLRGSYGQIGNQQAISPFQYQALFSTGYAASVSPGNLGYPFNKIYQRGYAPTQPANPDLKWETDYETDIGMDAAFLHNSITLTVDWFHRKSQDFLLTLAAPAQTGFNYLTRNVGSMENKGLEIAVNYHHPGREFTYGIGVTFTAIQNKLLSIASGTDLITNFGGLTVAGDGWGTFTETHVGDPVGEFWGYKSLGVFQSQKQVDDLNAASAAKNPSYPYYQKPVTQAGDRYFADVNGDGHVDGTDQTKLGSPLPKIYGGLNFDATYKGFDFNLYFYGVYGNKILNYVKSSQQSFQNRSFVGVQNVSYDFYVNHWTPSNPSNTYSRASYNDDATGSNVPSSAWIEDGSFLKLKNITVGYTFNADFLKTAMITKLRVYISAQNLFTITKYSGLDPEIGIQGGNATQNGVDNGTYPSSKFFTFGLNVVF
ncbi:MAG TPA: TonB-dependent receptor [Puia sp.]|nr:TonB-dependent receptor [Puia sp.]